MVQEIDTQYELNTFDKLELFMKDSEEILNPLGYIPLVSSIFTGEVRATLGLIQVISSVVATPFMFIADLFGHERGAFYRTSKCISHFSHGVSNIVRGAVESIPILGNLCTIVYDQVIGVRMKYSIEYSRPDLFNRVHYLNPQLQGI